MNDNLNNNTLPINEIVKNFVDFINRSGAASKEILKIPAITLLTDMEEIIKNNPHLTNITVDEANATNDLQKIFELLEEKYSSAIASKDIELLRSILPKKHTKPNNKLANKITKNLMNEGTIELVINNKKAKKEVTTKVMLNYEDDNVQLISRAKFTAYDREVYDGVTTLYEAGNEIVTPAMIYRAMNGLTETEYIQPEALLKIKESIDKSRFIRTVIDYTDEAKLYHQEVDKTIYEGYLLNCEKINVEAGGKELEAYKLMRKPILYEYAQISGQIISIPINLLNTKDTVNSTEDVTIIRGYLLRQIEWMKHERSKRDTNITYQGIYEELEVYKKDFDKRAYENKIIKIRKHVKAILESWKIQNYINYFEEYKDGRQIKGVKINL